MNENKIYIAMIAGSRIGKMHSVICEISGKSGTKITDKGFFALVNAIDDLYITLARSDEDTIQEAGWIVNRLWADLSVKHVKADETVTDADFISAAKEINAFIREAESLNKDCA